MTSASGGVHWSSTPGPPSVTVLRDVTASPSCEAWLLDLLAVSQKLVESAVLLVMPLRVHRHEGRELDEAGIDAAHVARVRQGHMADQVLFEPIDGLAGGQLVGGVEGLLHQRRRQHAVAARGLALNVPLALAVALTAGSGRPGAAMIDRGGTIRSTIGRLLEAARAFTPALDDELCAILAAVGSATT